MLKFTFSISPIKKHNGTINSITNMNVRNGQSPSREKGNTINNNLPWGKKGGFPHATFASQNYK